MMAPIRPLEPIEWRILKDLRTRSVVDAPDAFQPLDPVLAGSDEYWQEITGSLASPDGDVLVVEEGNPPCSDMGAQIKAKYTTRSGEPAAGHLFAARAFGLRGVVGVVDVPGSIKQGDEIVVHICES
jgi:hypothetical protein